MFQQILIYTAFPVIALIIGGLTAAAWPPNRRILSYFQHFAAGIVFAAVAGEVLPSLVETHPGLVFIVIGFGIGVLLMLTIRWLVENKVSSGSDRDEQSVSTDLILVVGIDLLIDGLLLGIGIALGEVNGVLIAIALTIEILFLGLTVTATLIGSDTSKGKATFTVGLLAIPLALGVFAGSLLFAGISHDIKVMLLSFAAAALLFLVTEELLVEAHEVKETPIATSSFFVGFLLLYLIELRI